MKKREKKEKKDNKVKGFMKKHAESLKKVAVGVGALLLGGVIAGIVMTTRNETEELKAEGQAIVDAFNTPMEPVEAVESVDSEKEEI